MIKTIHDDDDLPQKSPYDQLLKNFLNPVAPVKSKFEQIMDIKKMVLDQLGISVTDLEPGLSCEYTAKSDDGSDVNIYSTLLGDICFAFDNVITLDNGMVSSHLKSPLIQGILTDVNRHLPVTESFRLSNDLINYLPVLPNVKPWLVFKYIKATKMRTVQVSFKVLRRHVDSLPAFLTTSYEAYRLTTKNKAIQHFYESSGFNCIYSDSGVIIDNEIEVYKERMMKIWELPEDSTDIDYKRLGILSDMISI